MHESAAKIRALIARFWKPVPEHTEAQPLPDQPAAAPTEDATPLFSLGEGPQELVVSYRSGETEQS